MRIISFAHTTPALIAGEKTVTRRNWKTDYAFQFKEGMHLQAWNKSPRYKGIKVAEIVLTCDPFREYTKAMPDIDYKNEGFKWMLLNDVKLGNILPTYKYWFDWKRRNELLWVVRFELVKIF